MSLKTVAVKIVLLCPRWHVKSEGEYVSTCTRTYEHTIASELVIASLLYYYYYIFARAIFSRPSEALLHKFEPVAAADIPLS